MVVIDDARLLVDPEGYTGYPKLHELRQQIGAIGRRMSVVDDMIVIEPR